jgi:hypothetical protein
MGTPLPPIIANFFMEDIEERAIAQATHKPLCWFRQVGDTFVIWPHGTEKLERFLDHMKGLYRNIQLNMETERGGHLTFLEFDIYRRLDGTLGHKVY